MEKESHSVVNNKYVLVLVEDQNQNLSVKEYPIEDSEAIVSNIEAIVENKKETLWDLFSIVDRYLGNKKCYNLCFPYEYNSSYISGANRPEEVTYNPYDFAVRKRREEIISSYKYRHLDNVQKKEYLTKCLSFLENEIAHKEHPKKKEYAKRVIRFIKCKYLSEALEEVKKDRSIKMFSSDSIGWTTFEYPISEDIKVMIKTNFVYGSAAFFIWP